MKTIYSKSVVRAIVSVSLLAAAGAAAAATTTVNLTAQRMTATLPDGKTVPMWGYCKGTDQSATPISPNPCPAPAATAAWAPGPTITVTSGDTLTINFSNSLPVQTSIVVLGQIGGGLGTPTKIDSPTHAPQTQTTWPANGDAAFTPPTQGQRVRSFATEVGKGATAPLSWANLKPGTYIYETGTLPSIQAPMGLYGVLVVTQPPTAAGGTSNAYPGMPPAPGVPYDYDTALLFSEIDPVQNAAVDNAALNNASLTARFDDTTCVPNCYPAAVNYTPTYFLINGQAYDQSAPQKSAFSVAGTSALPGAASAPGRVLIRLLNAGLRTHIPSFVGLPMSIVAEDGNLAPGKPKLQNEVLLTAGKTHDVLVNPPITATAYSPSTFPLFDRQLSLSGDNKSSSGMQGFLQVASAGAAAGTVGALPAAATPTVVDDNFQVPLNTTINGNVKLNDIAVGAVATTSTPANGALVFNADGTFTYTPASGYIGTQTFTYNVAAATTGGATVTLNIATGGLGGPPTANADTYVSTISTKFTSTRPGLLSNDTDPRGYPLTAAWVSNGDCGTVTVNADGSFTALRAGTGKSCTFTYSAVNSQGTKSTTAGTATVTFIPDKMVTGPAIAVTDQNGAAVGDYRWIIQEDLTFKVDPTGTPSLATRTLGTSFHRSYMPVVATGCVGPVSCGTGQFVRGAAAGAAQETPPEQAVLDPTKHYYVSILPGDAGGDANGDPGHSMGGAEIKPQVNHAWAPISVNSNAYPWVPAQLSVYIYEDNSPINNQDDLNETGLGGFNIVVVDAVGRSGDPAGQQTYDAYGMPLSNALLGTPGCPDGLNTRTNGTATSATGNTVGVIYTCPNAPANFRGDPARYALAGHALIKNLTPARYDVLAHPGAAREGAGEVWWQTETLEGTQAQDAFTGVNEPVYFQEFGPPGFHTTIGFVNPDNVKRFARQNRLTGPYHITGRVTNQHMSRPSNTVLWDSESFDLLSSTTCQVGLNSQGGSGPGIAIASCDRDGNWSLDNVPAGSYEVVIWDQWLDQIINTQAVVVDAAHAPNNTLAMGDIP
jgi:FtsP/CotA-like multicopper oxidase with cupredoxin domain